MQGDVWEEAKSVMLFAFGIVKKIDTLVTEETICAILDKYKGFISIKRRELIRRFLLSKIQLLEIIYGK